MFQITEKCRFLQKLISNVLSHSEGFHYQQYLLTSLAYFSSYETAKLTMILPRVSQNSPASLPVMKGTL